jgi:hypothetical protein
MGHNVPALLAALFAMAIAAAAQTTSSSVLGVVTDPSGSPVAGAEVQALSQSTGDALTTATNNVGQFRFPVLQRDRYSVTVRANGFKLYRSGVGRSPDNPLVNRIN